MERKALTCLKCGFLFLFVGININGFDVLPDFVGIFLLLGSIQSHSRQTEAERKVKPLLFVLAVDYFLHWILDFQNGLENLLAMVIFLYVIFVLIGEVAERVRPEQPDVAGQLRCIRQWIALQQMIYFVVTAYDNAVLNTLAILVALITWIVLIVALCGIRAVSDQCP